jgi:hypothetical protein
MQPSVKLNVKAQTSPEYALNIMLTNKSAEALTIYQHALPWVGRYSMLLIAVQTDAAGTMLDKTLPVDDPGAARITIKPKETLAGKIVLVNCFPGFLEALKERDVIVFWSYQFQPIDAAPLKRVGGYVLFAKSSEVSLTRQGHKSLTNGL